MENDKYIVSARKYRPATFRSVVGQKTLTNTLKNAIATERLAQAYLFCGPRGVGKTSCARIFARTINCLTPDADGEACGHCDSCRAIEEGTSFNIVELDAASNNGVDSMRSLTEQVNTPPQVGKYRVFIIDEVHMLSSGAFNAFLKTLEEPPSYVIFILATTEKHKVIPTILSRCQIYDFKRITVEDMVDHLAYVAEREGMEAQREALAVMARKADGAMRDALSIFDQVASSTRGHITYERAIENLNVLDYDYYFRLTDTFRTGDIPKALLIYADIRNKGFDSLYFVNGLATHIRDLMLAASPDTVGLLEQSEDLASRYQAQASLLPLEWYYAAMKLLNDCDQAYRTASEKRLLVELTLIRLCQLLKPPTPPFDKVDGQIPLQAIMQPVYHAEEPAAVMTKPEAAPRPTSAPVASGAPLASGAALASGQVSAPGISGGNLRKRRTASIRASEAEPVPTPAGTAAAHSPREDAQSPDSESPHIRPTYTEEEFQTACAEFMSRNEQYRIMNAALRKHYPEPLGNGEYLAVATQPSEFASYESDVIHLVEYLRATLHDENISIRVELRESKAEREHLLTSKEFLADTLGKNKPLAEFLEAIHGEMI